MGVTGFEPVSRMCLLPRIQHYVRWLIVSTRVFSFRQTPEIDPVTEVPGWFAVYTTSKPHVDVVPSISEGGLLSGTLRRPDLSHQHDGHGVRRILAFMVV